MKRLFVSLIVFAFIGIGAMTFLATAEADTTVVVTPTQPQGFSTEDTRPGGMVNYVSDPSSPGGDDALQLTTTASGAAKAQYIKRVNVPLSQVTELSYYTKQVEGPPHANSSYQFLNCLGGLSEAAITPTNPIGCVGFTTLVFEPYQMNGQNAVTQPIVNGVWQQWDVDQGSMWSSQAYSDGTCTVAKGFGGAPFYTLAQMKANCPNAVTIGFGVNIGSNNPGYNVHADLVSFNGVAYDFEQDTDADGVVDEDDNCPTTSNADQLDTDNDGTGNACDTDDDNDGVLDGPDNCDLAANPNQADGDNDGIGDACDPDAVAPTTAQACKNGGWQNFYIPRRFKNQGDCIQFVNTGK